MTDDEVIHLINALEELRTDAQQGRASALEHIERQRQEA